MATTETPTTGPWCEDCAAIVEAVQVYECSRCGTRTDERRCSDCNIFAAKADGLGCESCFAEVEEIEIVEDHDGEIIRAEDYEPDGEANSVRAAAAAAAAEVHHAAEQKAREKTVLARGTTVTWGDLAAGDQIVAYEYDGSIDTLQNATILSIITVGENHSDAYQAGEIVALVGHYGVKTVRHAGAEEVVYMGRAEGEDAPMPRSERFTASAGGRRYSGSLGAVTAGFGPEGHSSSKVPVGFINAMASEYSSMVTSLGVFVHPDDARAYAVAVRQAHELLAAMPEAKPAVPVQVQWEDAKRRVDQQVTNTAHFTVGMDDFNEHGSAALLIGNYLTGMDNTGTLLAIADAADTIADRLTAGYGLEG